MEVTPARVSAPPKFAWMNEDWLALGTGLFLFLLSLGSMAGMDLLGWAVSTSVWTTPAKALAATSKTYAAVPGAVALLFTYALLLAVTTAGARLLHLDLRRFVTGFTAVFALSYLSWIAGSWAYIAATPDKRSAFGISWSLSLTNEAGFIVALLAGLAVGNFFPGLSRAMKEAIRPELYVKTAIVILGGFLGVTAAEQFGLATSVMFRGLCAIMEAYLIYWAVVYYIARRYFHFSREWAAPLASGISICGVSAAIATGSAIRARPVVPIMVSSLVVIFAVVELLFLPFVAQHFLYHQPMVAGAWMALAVKTDGAAVASGAIADSLIGAKALAENGVRLRARLDHGHHRHGQGLHRHLHRGMGVRAGVDLVGPHRKARRRQRARGGDLAALSEVRAGLRGHFPGGALDRAAGARRGGEGERLHGRRPTSFAASSS